MTRIVGSLLGPDGPLTGRLFIKPSAPFIGFSKDLSFKIVDGVVDIELPPNTSTTVFYAGWKDQFDMTKVEYSERWHVPRGVEVSLDVVRGMQRRESTQAGRTAGVDQVMWKMEAEKGRERIKELESNLRRAELAIQGLEGRAAAATGKLAGLQSECAVLQRKLVEAQKPEVRTEIIEKEVLSESAKETLKVARKQLAVLQAENDVLQSQVREGIAASTLVSNLQHEVDRLKIEKQDLLYRIEELKQPRRSTSSLRQEMIANLDKLIDG